MIITILTNISHIYFKKQYAGNIQLPASQLHHTTGALTTKDIKMVDPLI